MVKQYGTPGPRSVSPDCATSEKLAACSLQAQLLWHRLMVAAADDQGRFLATASRVLAQCFPLHDELETDDARTWLGELAAAGLVILYRPADTGAGKPRAQCGQLTNWWAYQVGQRRAYPSKWPPPDGWKDLVYGLPPKAISVLVAAGIVPAGCPQTASDLPDYAVAVAGAYADAHRCSRDSRDSPPADGGRPHGGGPSFDDKGATGQREALRDPGAAAGTQDAPKPADGLPGDPDGDALAKHLVEVLHNTGVDKSARATKASSTGFGRLVRRLAKGGGGSLAASLRVRDAIDGVFAHPEPDSSGFCWADVLRSGQSWASKTRDKSRYKFEMVEQQLARGGLNGSAKPKTLAERNAAAMDEFIRGGSADGNP